ncbi:MAG: hypothetical protein P9L97_08990 [Candidatus Tenebribacter davisii]|jgi:hypothetical protein|nr:hypothetical protein [Candidatus Tenebribacter davisii]
MKKGIFFQIIVIFFILLGWNLLHIGYDFQKDLFERNISSLPMMVLSMQENTLEQVKIRIEKKDYIEDIIIIQDSVIAQTLISNYDLVEGNEILRSYILPTAMQINFRGEIFQIEQKQELDKILLEYSPGVIHYFDDQRWQIDQNKISLLTKAYYAGFGIFIIFMMFIAILLRVHFEMKNDHFWKIFHSSGGNYRKRGTQYFINSIYICLIPLILNLAIYYTIRYMQLLSVKIDYKIFGIEILTIIISSVFAAITLREHLK